MRYKFIIALLVLTASIVFAAGPDTHPAREVCLYVDSASGSDTNAGTAVKPLMTLDRAAVFANQNKQDVSVTIRLAPGIYSLDRTVVFDNNGTYTKDNRLTITAQYLPDDPSWTPSLMPTILSTETPRNFGRMGGNTETFSIKIDMSHVTFSGLRFLGNPSLKNHHAVIDRIGVKLEDLVITQCMFIGGRNGLDIYCPVIGTGDELIVDHCVFVDCHSSAVFWDGPDGIPGKRNAMTYCIIYGGYISGPWTCQTSDDFEFHHNVISNCRFAWMRKPGDYQRYSIKNCIVVNCESFSGSGGPFGPFQRTGKDVTFKKDNVIETGQIMLEQNRYSHQYLQLTQDSLGRDLGAGLFKKQ